MTNTAAFTKVGQNRTHPSGVTLVKESAVTSAYHVLVPGQSPQRVGSYATALKLGKAAVAQLEG